MSYSFKVEDREDGFYIILEYKGRKNEYGPFKAQNEVNKADLIYKMLQFVASTDGTLTPRLDSSNFERAFQAALEQIPVKGVKAEVVEEGKFGDFRDYMIQPVKFFTINHFYTKTQPIVTNEGLFRGEKKLWTIYLAKEDKNYPWRFIVDQDGYVNPRILDLAVSVESNPEELKKFIDQLPKSKINFILRVLRSHGLNVEDGDDLPQILAQSYVFVWPVPKLRDPSILEKMGWREFTDELIAWKCEKDERIKLVHKATLLRGIESKINPHSLQFTNAGTGKTEFYERVGHRHDKVTPRSFLGFAKSPEEMYPGVVDGTELPFGIDQIESQGAPQIMRYLFTAMEQGYGRVSSGAVEFLVKTKSSFHILGNPIGYETSPMKSFGSLIDHISYNPAIGRRFGIIVYGRDFKRVRPKTKDLTGWSQAISFFRAVEEYALPELKKISEDEDVWGWLRTPIPNYSETIKKVIEGIENEAVRVFLEEHALGAQHRVRAAALNVAIVENLDKISLKKYDIKDLLSEAEDHLSEFIDINVSSIVKIAEALEEEVKLYAKTFFDNLPSYMKEIVSAVELWRRTQPETNTINLKEIPYQPKDTETYAYFSRCINRLLKRKNVEKLNEKLQRYFNFRLKRVNKDFEVFLLNTSPCEYIEPLGTLIHLSDLSIYPQSQRETTPTQDTSSLNKRINGENGEMDKNEVIISGRPGDRKCAKCPVCKHPYITNLKLHLETCHSELSEEERGKILRQFEGEENEE